MSGRGMGGSVGERGVRAPACTRSPGVSHVQRMIRPNIMYASMVSATIFATSSLSNSMNA